MKRWILLTLCTGWLATAWHVGKAWDTNVESPFHGWLSIYNSMGLLLEEEARRGDEHTAISDWALRALGAEQYSYNQSPVRITDLNASVFREKELGALGSYDGGVFIPNENDLETRQLPAPSQFSGLPDYSYTLYDWINKNYYCPPREGLSHCHDFQGWMGALNSNHFGSQAGRTYQRLHKLALNLARRARALREKLARDQNALKAYEDYVREAEYEALSVEGYAQHFLQDIWAMGHMWERWGTADYDVLPNKKLGDNIVVAAFAGLLHGAEGSTGMPDALSSPQVSWGETMVSYLGGLGRALLDPRNGFLMPHWKQRGVKAHQAASFSGFPGVGDYRFLDALDGGFGKEYKSVGRDFPIAVGAQKQLMIGCLKAGWYEVIRAFGENSAGGFGIDSIKPKRNAKDFSALGHRCDDQWATNVSMWIGWNDNISRSARRYGNLARSIIEYNVGGNISYRKLSSRMRLSLLRITLIIDTLASAKALANDSSVASGRTYNMDFSFDFAKTGDQYAIASYTEPEDIARLPDRSNTGKDKEAWFGFFNRSHVDYWCGAKGVALLEKLRSSGSPRARKACEYLADRFYEGTDPSYKGRYQERRTVNRTEGGQPIHGVCHFFGAEKLWNPNRPNEVPIYLSGGYVGKPYGQQNHGGYQTIAHWCERVPVLHYLRGRNGQIPNEAVARVRTWDEPVVVTGEDLGGRAGKLIIDCGRSGSVRVPEGAIQEWTASRIVFDLGWLPEKKKKEDVHSLCVERFDGKRSVGVFELRRKGPYVGGRVKDEHGGGLSGATVALVVMGERLSTRSQSEGGYRIDIPAGLALAETVIVTATKPGYQSGSVIVSKDRRERADITLSRRSEDVIDIAPELHHLGDGRFEGVINSRFQEPNAEGMRLSRSFTVKESVALDAGRQPVLTMEAKGLEDANPVLLNGRQVGVLSSSDASGGASRIELPIDACAVRAGENRLVIRSADSDGNGDFDDFEIANVQLHFRPLARQASIQDGKATILDRVRILTEAGRPTKGLALDERFSIEGEGKGDCGVRPDVAFVFVFPQSGGEEAGKKVPLVETGPDTGLFRTEQPMTPAAVPVRAGDRLVVRAGLRAASVVVAPEAAPPARERARELLDEARRAEAAYDRARRRWRRLSDFIDEKRSKGESVEDLMANLRELAEAVQQARARVVEARRKAGLQTGSIAVDGKPVD